MSGAGADVQKALYAKLEAALSATVYDHVPPNAAFPYVTIGDDTSIPWDTKAGSDLDYGFGEEITVTIHAWSRKGGRKEVKQIGAAIYAALHNKALTMDDHALVQMQFEFGDSFLDADGVTYHGVSRYRLLVQQ